MKSKILFIAIVALAMVGCKFHFVNDPVDESVLPKGEPTDNTCSINIPQSAYEICGMTYEEADAYLRAAGWIKSPTFDQTYVCADTTTIPGYNPNVAKEGPRCSMSVNVIDGMVKGTSLRSTCFLSERPYQLIARWDAWFYNHVNNNEKWEAQMSVYNASIDSSELHSYFGETNGDHQRFFTDIQSLNDSEIWRLTIKYSGAPYAVDLSVVTQNIDGYCNITMNVMKVVTFGM